VRHRVALALALLFGAAAITGPGNAAAQTQPSVTVAVGFPANVLFDPCGVVPVELPRVGDGSFVLTVTGDVGTATEVHLSWGGTAVPGTDYTTPPSSIAIAPGVHEVTVAVHLLSTDALGKTVVLTILAGTGYTVGNPASATMTIVLFGPAVACFPSPPPVVTNPPFTG
jgi:hypothetical protein